MAKYDIETLLTDLTTFLKSNLNTQIAAINTEKADSITLLTVNDAAYHFQYLGDKYESYDPFVLVEEIKPSEVQSAGPNVATTHEVGISLVKTDNGDNKDIPKWMFRYRRVLEDLVRANWDKLGKSGYVTLRNFTPTPPFGYISGDWEGRAVGVVLKVTFA